MEPGRSKVEAKERQKFESNDKPQIEPFPYWNIVWFWTVRTDSLVVWLFKVWQVFPKALELLGG